MQINIITVIIFALLIIYLLKGLNVEFSVESMFDNTVNILDNTLFLISLISSVYLTRGIFVIDQKEGIFADIYNMVPKGIMSYLEGLGILIYVTFTPLILLAMLFVLIYLRSFLDKPLRSLSNWICTQVNKTHVYIRKAIGIIIELPKVAVIITVLVFLSSIVFNNYPAHMLARQAQGSQTYNYIYNSTVLPVVNSSLWSRVPVFVQFSMQEIAKGIEDNKVLNKSEDLKTFGFLRFQYETKSNEEIDNMAKKIVGKETDERKKAYLLYKWIGSNIAYDWRKFDNINDGNNNIDKYGAIVAYETRKGICEDYSDLYVAMAKAAGLKVRIIVGQGYSMDNWGGHAWNQVYIEKEQKWISLDTTWAMTGNYFDNKDFDKGHIFEAVAGEW